MSSESAQSLDIRGFLTRHLVEVFDTMLSVKALPMAKFEPTHYAERVSGSVGFAGDNVNGAVYLHLSGDFAKRMAAAMLGLAPEELGEADINDVIGEVTNMLTGGLKSALCDHGTPCAVSTPAIIRGTSFVIEPIVDVERLWLAFDCGADRVVVEVHIKYS